MSKNTKEILLGNKRYLLIDLTQPLKLDTEVYPGDPKPIRKIFSDINKTGWLHYIHEVGDHHFQPHGDAPNHQNSDLKNKGFEFFGMDYYFNRACLIDLSNSIESQEIEGIKYLINVKKEHLEPFIKQLSQVGAVIIRTGYDKWLEKNKPHTPNYLPYLDKDAAKFISSFENIKIVGIDSLTVDAPESHDSHHILKNHLIVESLVHLYNIPIKNRSGFDIQTNPLKIIGATGGPIIANAFLEL